MKIRSKSTPLQAILLLLYLGSLKWGYSAEELFDEFAEWDGEQLARAYCITCHLYPDPELLPQQTWPYVLDLMGLYFGYDDRKLLSSIQDQDKRKELFDTARYPSEPSLNPFQWAAIRDFYESSLGAKPVEPPPVALSLEFFDASLIYGDESFSVASLVRIAEDGSGVFVGDAENHRLLKYNPSGQFETADQLPGAIVQLEFAESRDVATVIGRMHPSNIASGSIMVGRAGENNWKSIVEELHRPVHSLVSDFDGDGEDEVLVSEFGHYVGSLSLIETRSEESTERTVLNAEPGSISTWVLPEEGGGDNPDIIALRAQAGEEIVLYRNKGNLRFEAEKLLQQPPSFGYTQLHFVDITGDGIQELVTINGDNADLPGAPLKAYHGVRIYRFLAGPSLEEIAFLPVPGAFQATFSDFNADGRTDIAVVSYFPDSRRDDQGFVLFENNGAGDFQRFSMPVGSAASWMTIDSGDLDGDGDVDIVLGAGYEHDRGAAQEAKKLAVAILRNRLATVP